MIWYIGDIVKRVFEVKDKYVMKKLPPKDWFGKIEDVYIPLVIGDGAKLYQIVGLAQPCESYYVSEQWLECFFSKVEDKEGAEPALKITEARPPQGLKPRMVHEEERMNEIIAAMRRYAEAKKDIPQEWICELLDLTKGKTVSSWIVL